MISQQEKRESLARWEGWHEPGRNFPAHWAYPHPVNGWADIQHATEPPDYWNDGNAMLRLMRRCAELRRTIGIVFYLGDVRDPEPYVAATLVPEVRQDPPINARAPEAPAAVAEAVYEAIS